MSASVLDASALLALLLGEPGGSVVADALDGAVVSSVNLAEVASYYAKLGAGPEAVRQLLDALPLDVVAADHALALAAGALRRPTLSAGLSLGDRFCLALAHQHGLPALTADRTWRDIAEAVGVEVRVIR